MNIFDIQQKIESRKKCLEMDWMMKKERKSTIFTEIEGGVSYGME